ncbi:MAG: chromate transporter [Clostridia bacterium]|nr:chromate transporter [Clostridia bacterium]
MKKFNFKKFLKLFYFSLYVSAVAFGGGFVVLKLLRETFVKKLSLITDVEMDDYVAVAQASPGSIALNVSILIGLKTAGVLGMIATVLGSVIPPFTVITGLYFFYDLVKDLAFVSALMAGMQAGVAGVIACLVYDTIKDTLLKKNLFETALLAVSFLVSFSASFLFELNVVVYMIILSALLGVAFSYLRYFAENKRGKKE